MEKNLYANTAKFYDKGNEITNYVDDIEFYKSFVDSNTKVLELGCGTGRVTLSLVDKCKCITGIELSDQMLDILQKKVNNLESEQQRKIQLIKGDITNFRLNEKFDLIIFPGLVFQALITGEMRENCLKCVKEHLSSEGKIIIDLFDTDYEKVDNTNNTRLNFEYFDEELDCIVKKYSVIEKHNREKQTHSMKYTFEICKGDELIESIEDIFELSYLYENQARELFIINQINIKKLYGWYDFSPRDEKNKRMLIYILN